MAREIKFRVFSNGNYYYNHSFNLSIDGELTCLDIDGVWKSIKESEIHKDAVLEQFTGLKDKNGRDIYEGDRILAYWRTFPKIYNVYMDKETQMWSIESDDEDHNLQGLYDYHFDCEVVIISTKKKPAIKNKHE